MNNKPIYFDYIPYRDLLRANLYNELGNGENILKISIKDNIGNKTYKEIRFLLSNLMRYNIIGITGGSGSGKTYLSNLLQKKFGKDNINIIQMDSYYNDLKHLIMDEREKSNFDHPEAFDFNLLLNHLKILDSKGKVEIPIYDYKTHTRESKTNTIFTKPILIIEGIFAVYNEKIRAMMNLVVFIDIDNNIRKKRRIERDIMQRKRTKESIINQYENIVEPMQKKYIFPMKNKSDLILKENSEKSYEFNKLLDYINKVINQNE